MVKKNTPPVIITGMHRSGTSIVTRLLGRLGLMIGEKKDQNEEASFFQNFNKWMLHQCDGSWEHPQQIHYLLDNAEIRVLLVDYLRYMLKTPHVISYLGIVGYLRYRSLFKVPIPWGWKDPRNSFTLPIWLELFPEAKVINIYRHGIDIAHSLKTRHDTFIVKNAQLHERRKWYYWAKMKSGGFAGSMRSATIDGAFTLWEEYMREDQQHIATLGDRVIRIKYEDFLQNPHELLEELVQFCGLDTTRGAIDAAVGELRKSRRFAYLQDKELTSYALKYQKRLCEFGY